MKVVPTFVLKLRMHQLIRCSGISSSREVSRSLRMIKSRVHFAYPSTPVLRVTKISVSSWNGSGCMIFWWPRLGTPYSWEIENDTKVFSTPSSVWIGMLPHWKWFQIEKHSKCSTHWGHGTQYILTNIHSETQRRWKWKKVSYVWWSLDNRVFHTWIKALSAHMIKN